LESREKRAKRAKRIFEILDPLYTHDKTALHYTTPFELLVATILSAQCTDKQVNEVTKTLFKKYKAPKDYLAVPLEELEHDIRPTGFYHNKAKSLRGCCKALIELFGGEVPSNMEDLLRLPGVGRKTANCVLGAAFDVPGIVVDTHVKRLAVRMGLTDKADADKIELDLQGILPKERWRRFSDILIYHGREVCTARKPTHERCPVRDLCPSASL
jgi:endonuclease-3